MDLSRIKAVTAGKTKTSGISPFSELELSKVYPNPDQPRKQFDDIEELAGTIKEHGLLQPITVVKKDNGYMIISGERRYKAHLHNEAKTIKAHIVNVTDEAVEELTLIENIQRNDLTDFETAKHIVKLWESGRYEKKSDLAKKIGKSESYISKAFSCLKLDNEILEDIEANKKDISIGVMDEIARVKDKTVQKEVYEKYSSGEITRDEIKEFKEPKKTIKEKVEDIIFKAPISCSYVEEISPREISVELKDFELEILSAEGRYLHSDFIKAKNKNQALMIAYKRFPDDAKDNDITFNITEIEKDNPIEFIGNTTLDATVTFDNRGLSSDTLGAFYLYGVVCDKKFDKSKKYKIYIKDSNEEELDETAALKQKIKELEKEIEELKSKNTKEIITRDEIKFTKVDNVKVIISDMEDYIKSHNAYLDGHWIKDSTGTLETHLDNDYEIELFRLLMENHELKKV